MEYVYIRKPNLDSKEDGAKAQYPLEQVCYRLTERILFQENLKSLRDTLDLLSHESGPLVAPCRDPQFKKVTLPGNVALGVVARNSCCLLTDGSIVLRQHCPHAIWCSMHYRTEVHSPPRTVHFALPIVQLWHSCCIKAFRLALLASFRGVAEVHQDSA